MKSEADVHGIIDFGIREQAMGSIINGPTHQPVEHLISLRIIPGLENPRPADAEETASAGNRQDLSSGHLILKRPAAVSNAPAMFPSSLA
jgi:transketolase